MKSNLLSLFIFLIFTTVQAQEGFHIQKNTKKVTIPFQLMNNLIIIPIQVNDVTLNFLLDTGVEESILFSLDESDEISFSKIEKIRIRGFGNNEPFEAYKSTNNRLRIKDYVDLNHTLFLVLDKEINISSQIGIPVNGILGYHFFKNNLVQINYQTKKITIYSTDDKKKEIAKSYSEIPLDIINGKPFVTVTAFFENPDTELDVKLLIDSGNTDALWLFKERNKKIKMSEVYFDDFLGKGFSGEIFGKRGRIKAVKIGDKRLENPIVSFPDAASIVHIDTLNNRLGSIGSDIIKRFNIYFNYPAKTIYLKKNAHFSEPFHFNMSGIEINHQGLQWVTETYQDNPTIANNVFDSNGDKISSLKYKFELKPVYIISNLRKNSPADLVGLQKDDVVVKINRRSVYNYKLQEISDLLKSEEGKTIEIEVERKGKLLKFKFQLKTMI